MHRNGSTAWEPDWVLSKSMAKVGNAGPVEFEMKLDPYDILDYADSVLGLGGFGSNGDITVTYSLQHMKLSGDIT